MYGLHSKFDVQSHKQTFINYLEVCIDERGEIHYAIPSHQEWLINRACNNINVSREQLEDLCPKEYYGDFLSWLLQITGCVSVWNSFYMGKSNEAQLNTLLILKEQELFCGEL